MMNTLSFDRRSVREDQADRKMEDRKIRKVIFLSSIFLSAWSWRRSNLHIRISNLPSSTCCPPAARRRADSHCATRPVKTPEESSDNRPGVRNVLLQPSLLTSRESRSSPDKVHRDASRRRLRRPSENR